MKLGFQTWKQSHDSDRKYEHNKDEEISQQVFWNTKLSDVSLLTIHLRIKLAPRIKQQRFNWPTFINKLKYEIRIEKLKLNDVFNFAKYDLHESWLDDV